MFSKTCLAKARFLTAAWVGAASLFVVNGVRLVTSESFDAAAKDHMALIRFPPYYLFGGVLVGTALVCTLFTGDRLPAVRRRFVLALLAGALFVMAYDWLNVYGPLAGQLAIPGQPRNPEFLRLHRLSKIVNAVHVGMVLAAASILSWPTSSGSSPPLPPSRL